MNISRQNEEVNVRYKRNQATIKKDAGSRFLMLPVHIFFARFDGGGELC